MRLSRIPIIALFIILLSFAILFSVWRFFSPYRDLDILIVNGTVADGDDGPPHICDIAVRDGKIVGIGKWRFIFSRAALRIDAENKIVAPGFIDVHAHIEANIPSAKPFRPANFLRQGVTTLITGNCGRSVTDVAELLRTLERNSTYINVATLIGHNSVRQAVMNDKSLPPSAEELWRMQMLVERAMKAGAFGFSSGLAYMPGRLAKTDEVTALAASGSKFDGIYVSHIRDEERGGIAAITEALEIGRRSGSKTHISHFKASGPLQWGSITQRLQLLDRARAAGQRVTVDVYPYDRSSATTDLLLPDWAVKDNRAGLRQAAHSMQARENLSRDIEDNLTQAGWKDLSHVLIVSGRKDWIGQTLGNVPMPAGDLKGQIENLIEISLRGGAQAIYADMNWADVDAVVGYQYSVFGSDSAVRDPDGPARPHPRGCGTFPRIIRQYVRDRGALTITQAVHKATGQAAEIFGLANRGLLREGYWADIVIFDLAKIEDRANYDEPFSEPVGIDYVIVNGIVAVDHSNMVDGVRSGQPLRRGK